MASASTNGGGIPAGRLPPQAPSPIKVSSRQPKGRGSRSRRTRSSSEGVGAMKERYERQQQNQPGYLYGGGGGYQQNNLYPMGRLSEEPFGMNPKSSSNYGSIRPRTGSRDSKEGGFSAMNEITSVIGRSPNVERTRGMRTGNSRSEHKRSLSDSLTERLTNPPPMPPIYQGNQLVMPNPIFSGGDPRARTESGGSHHSHQFNPNLGVYSGGEPGGEAEAFLPQMGMSPQMGNNPNLKRSGRPRNLMRQNSVNNFMKSVKGEKQPNSCKDILWVVLFLTQLAVMCVVGLKFGSEALVETTEELGPGEGLEDDDFLDARIKLVLAHQNIIKMAYTCGAFAIIVSALALAFMMAMSRRLVYVALVLSIGVSFAWGTIGIGISPKSFVPITGIIALMLTVGYMFVVWDRIPFASANLTTALTGVRDNLGLVGVAFFFQFLALVCSINYSLTVVGLHNVFHENGAYDQQTIVVVSLLLLVSYYWTFQVLRHIVMVTVAGTIGSWWFGQPATLKETFTTATFYNFGSICKGSLFVGFVQFLRQITEGLRPNRDDSALMCFYECSLFIQEKIVNCVDNLADSFTPWAFTYMGLYHYGLKEAGHKANELFETRGWSRIVTDDLISSVLAMVSLMIGGLSGSFAVILQALDGNGLTSFGQPVLTSFAIGFVVGIVLSTVLFSIIDSSVCAVIVCFAGSPVEFHRHHMELSHEMRNAWKEVWPGSLDVESVGAGFFSS